MSAPAAGLQVEHLDLPLGPDAVRPAAAPTQPRTAAPAAIGGGRG